MSYHSLKDDIMPGMFPFPGMPGGAFLPGPFAPPDFQPSINIPYSINPTTLRKGEPVTISGNFGATSPFQVAVGFTNAGTQTPVMTGPNYGTVIVPDSAETGECYIEVNGSRVYGTSCVIIDSHPARVIEKEREPWSNQARGGSELIYVTNAKPTGCIDCGEPCCKKATKALSGILESGDPILGIPLWIWTVGGVATWWYLKKKKKKKQ